MEQLRRTFKIPFFSHFLFLVLIAGLLTSCGSRRTIVNGLDEKEANEILVFLSNKGINANKQQAVTEGGGGGKAVLWNISVESSRANEAMALLNQVGLPRRRGQNLLGIFSNVGLVPSGMQEKIRYQAGLAEQIASTIRKIDGVLDADVQISFPDEDPLNPGALKQKITASVYVKHSGVLDDPNAHLMTRIKRLVSGSVNGLDFDNVTVIGDRAQFSESQNGFQGKFGEEERPYVNVWSITLAKVCPHPLSNHFLLLYHHNFDFTSPSYLAPLENLSSFERRWRSQAITSLHPIITEKPAVEGIAQVEHPKEEEKREG